MARAGYHSTVTDAAGNIVPSANIEVRRLSAGMSLPQLYNARNGGAPLGNPFSANDDGSFTFYVSPGGAFQVKASKIIGEQPWEKIVPYAAIATGSEYDFDTLFQGVDLPGLEHLLFNSEMDSSEHVSSTSESAALKSFSLPANTYDKIKIEAVVRSRVDQDANAKANFTWRLKSATSTVKTLIETITANSTTGIDGGNKTVSTISTIIDGGQSVATLLSITAQMNVNNSATGSLVHSFRVYGIRDSAVNALVGPRDTVVVSFAISGKPRAGEIVEGTVFVDPVSFPEFFEGSEAVSREPADANAEFSITRDDVEIGTLTFAEGSTTGVFALDAEAEFEVGDQLDIVCPNPRDATLSGVKITLRGKRVPV